MGAAPVGFHGVYEERPERYLHPQDPRKAFWILSGIGGLTYSDVENFDAFLFLTSGRLFSNDTLELVRNIGFLKKEIFFVYTKIDVVICGERRKRSFDERTLLEHIRIDVSRNLENFLSNREDLFLISNHYPEKWDFHRLMVTILRLPRQCDLRRLKVSFQDFHTVDSISGTALTLF